MAMQDYDTQDPGVGGGGKSWWDQFQQPNATIANGPNAGKPAQPFPGYDAQHDPDQGSWQINDNTGEWYWLPNGSGTTHQGDVIPPQASPAPQAPSSNGPAANPLPAPPHIAPFSYTPWGREFQAPTADEAAKTPGYADALRQAQQALARSAAAKGTLLTGGTAKALQQQAVAYASQNYQNAYNNALTKYQTDYSTYQSGLLNALQTYSTNAGLSNQEYNNLLQAYGLSNQVGLGYGQLGLGYANLNSANINAANQLGLGYAGLSTQALMGGANKYADYLTQQGNANAAGSIAAGNAYSGIPNSLASGLTTAAIYGGRSTPQQFGNGLPGYQATPTPPPTNGYWNPSGAQLTVY